MTHSSPPKRVVFGPDSVEISHISTGKIIVKGVAIHAYKEYAFSHFIPYLDPVQRQLPFKTNKCIKIPLLPFAYTYLLSNISDSDSEEEDDQHDFDIEFTSQRDLYLDPASTSSQQPKWAQWLIKVVGDVDGDPDDKRRKKTQYQKENVALSHIDPLLPDRFFMMLGSYPQTFKEACHDPRWQETMDE